MDLIVGDREGYVNYYTRNADGTLHAQPDIIANGTTIDVGGNSAPVLVDWNGDGKLDLVLGSEGTYPTGDPIRLYLNSGTASSYIFTSYSSIQCSDSNILFYRSIPSVADLNMDGKKDLLVGELNAYLYYFENDGTNSSPHFSSMAQVQTVSGPIHEYSGLRQCVNNWNENGFPDLLTSDYDGYVRVYIANATGVEQGQGPVPQGSGIGVTGSPTRGVFTVMLTLDSPGSVAIAVYSQDGRLASAEELGVLQPGDHDFRMDLSGRAPGVYLLVCSTGSGIMSSRVVLTE